MLISTPRKTGRPTKVFKDRNGDRIVGLSRLGDGRWRASGPERYTFTEPDEALAILHFHTWKARKSLKTVSTPRVSAKISDVAEVKRAIKFLAISGPAPTPSQTINPFEKRPIHPATTPIQIELVEDRMVFYDKLTSEESFGPWLRKLFIEKKEWIAQITGIEQIGWMQDVKKPSPSPKLTDIGDLYLTKPKLTPNWVAKSKQFWREFCECVAVSTLREITQDHLLAYHDKVIEAASNPTYARQRFGAIKAVINYPTKRGKWAEDCKRVLAFCSVLVPPKKLATDPKPIDPEDFCALLSKADATMRAILLIGLNCAMYGSEVAALQWADVDLDKGTLVTIRNKTKTVRVATLWPQTVAALRALPRKSEAIFLTEIGTQADYLCIYRLFKIVRKAAGTEGVQFAQLRDGAYTAAVEAGIDLDTCRLLAGHATGISDHYVKRRPAMVAPACDAILKAYSPII